ncbi:mechanosensitive ion channel domain-containing protein [Undibacterium parvum]|uniref:Mechanosensitive ion channel n=1 Tax=Undibacterium parvum TaxID=401471 RepID=A0A3S9HIW7_9BURK|nr:mechanosensitive ion channel domain-containing protein [Undibacterium parvum]AZP12051.1 mechanosensitive ion channel [Undibacterium parvum]
MIKLSRSLMSPLFPLRAQHLLKNLPGLLLGLALSASAVAGPLDALIPKPAVAAPAAAPAVPAAGVAGESAKDAEALRISDRLDKVQTLLANLNQADAATQKGSAHWAQAERRRFWLEMERQAYLQHLAALEGIRAHRARQAEKVAAGSSASAVEPQNTQQLTLRGLIEQEINNLQRNLAIQERYLDTIGGELQRSEADLRQAQENLEKTSALGKERSQAAAALELSRHKKNAWSASLAAIDARMRFSRMRLQERRELVLAMNAAAPSDSVQVPANVLLEEEFARIASNQKRYQEQQQQLDNNANLLQNSLADLEQQQEKINTALSNEKTKNREDLEKKKQDFPQQMQWLQLRLETNAIHFGILSDLLMADLLQAAYWREYLAYTESSQSNSLEILNARSTLWQQNLNEVEKSTQIAAGIAQDQVAYFSKSEQAGSEDLKRHWQERQDAYAEALTDLRRSRMRFSELKEIVDHGSNKTIAMRVDYWGDKLRNGASNAWNLELFSVNDVINVDGQNVTIDRPVTIGKMLMAIMLLTIGFAIAVFIVNRIEKLLVQRGKFAEVSIKIGKRWLLSAIFIILLINSLLLVRIPLTVFAFLGGAVAIGLGFGMQTLLKNLISGLMMLLERPFKPGDTIEVGGLRGTVVDMSVRAAVVRDVNGIDTLIPNSSFLEQNVTNWTYSSSMVRQGIKVGIAYGSDVRLAAKLLEEDVLRHGQISSAQKPEILLEDFAADALLFGVYYWLDMSTGVVGRQVASDLRFMVEASFRKHEIAIAFPQRDVHLDSATPLRIQIERPDSKREEKLASPT